jgi:hypothetical protein
MELRNWIGLFILLIGVIIQPLGYLYAPWLKVVSFVLISIGTFVFIAQKYIDFKEEREFTIGSSHRNTSLPLFGDIFNFSGQRTGGRTEDWSSNSSDSCGGDSSE